MSIPVELASMMTSLLTFGGTHYWATRRYSKKLALSEERAQRFEADLKALTAQVTYWVNADHLVAFDGEPSAGKSALVAKWINPTVDIRALQKSGGVGWFDHHLCSETFVDEQQRKIERRHRLRYVDVPGEKPVELVPLFNRPDKPEVIIFVVDPTNVESSIDRFTDMRIDYLYSRQDVKDAVKAALVYVSKSDRFDPETLSQIARRVDEGVGRRLRSLFPGLRIVTGSALSGDGLPEMLGHIAQSLGVSKFFVRHQSLRDR